MMAAGWETHRIDGIGMKTVRRQTQRQISQQGVLCMALAHNEAKRVMDFLRHHDLKP